MALKLLPPPRPHIIDEWVPDTDQWHALDVTIADIAAGALLLFGLVIGAIGIVLTSFWVLSAFYDLVLRHIVEG